MSMDIFCRINDFTMTFSQAKKALILLRAHKGVASAGFVLCVLQKIFWNTMKVCPMVCSLMSIYGTHYLATLLGTAVQILMIFFHGCCHIG